MGIFYPYGLPPPHLISILVNTDNIFTSNLSIFIFTWIFF